MMVLSRSVGARNGQAVVYRVQYPRAGTRSRGFAPTWVSAEENGRPTAEPPKLR